MPQALKLTAVRLGDGKARLPNGDTTSAERAQARGYTLVDEPTAPTMQERVVTARQRATDRESALREMVMSLPEAATRPKLAERLITLYAATGLTRDRAAAMLRSFAPETGPNAGRQPKTSATPAAAAPVRSDAPATTTAADADDKRLTRVAELALAGLEQSSNPAAKADRRALYLACQAKQIVPSKPMAAILAEVGYDASKLK